MPDTIDHFMTSSVFTISSDRTLQDAHQLMREHKIRHLPVLRAGALVGLVTERDLSFVESLKDVDPSKTRVDDAMSQDVFSVSPDASLAEVCRRMAKEKLGSAVILEGRKVVGIFTAIDALRTLDFVLTAPPVAAALRSAIVPTESTPS